MRGCRFHLTQAWNCRISKLGLKATYQAATSQTAVWLKTVFGLPGLPPSDVNTFFENEMLTSAPRGDALHQFIEYLKVNYATSSSSLSPSMWAGVLDQTIKHTTNGCESFHRHFGRGNINPHPSVFDWLSEVSRSHKRAMIRANARRPVRTEKMS